MGNGEQRNFPFLLTGTWEHEQILQGNLGSKWILGSNSAFLIREQPKNIFGNKGGFGKFSREYGNTDTLGGLASCCPMYREEGAALFLPPDSYFLLTT